jgi:hypothetical protein
MYSSSDLIGKLDVLCQQVVLLDLENRNSASRVRPSCVRPFAAECGQESRDIAAEQKAKTQSLFREA